MKEPNLDEVGEINDYTNMPKFELQQRAIFGDARAERIYFKRYGKSKVDTVSAKALSVPEIQADWIED